MIIGLSGYAKAGKDEVAKYILETNKLWKIKKFSYKLKTIASILTGYHEDRFEDQSFKNTNLIGWGMTAREFLQKLGTESVRDVLHHDAWVNALFCNYGNHDKWVITDCRFPNEAQAIKDRGGIVVRVNRTGVNPINDHESEISLDDYDFDWIIENNGTIEDLKESVRILMYNI